MSPEELQAEKEKLVAEVATDPRFAKYLNKSGSTPPAAWDEDYKDLVNRYGEIGKELEARAARGKANEGFSATGTASA